MYTKTITNPNTKRQNKCRAWRIEPRKVCDLLKNGTIKSAKDLSWLLLDDDQSIQTCEREQYGDSASNNFALAIFEQALDWGLGIKALNFILAYVKEHKLPKPFELCCNRAGDVFIITATGRII